MSKSIWGGVESIKPGRPWKEVIDCESIENTAIPIRNNFECYFS